MKKSVVFALNVSSVADIITNSSSELFVLEGATEEIIESLLCAVYPDYLTEYESVKSTKDLTAGELDTYISYAEQDWSDDGRYDRPIFGIPPKDLYEDYENRSAEKYWYGRLSETGAEKLKKAMDPENKMWFLFSKGENPDWEGQESLSGIATRYHLG